VAPEAAMALLETIARQENEIREYKSQAGNLRRDIIALKSGSSAIGAAMPELSATQQELQAKVEDLEREKTFLESRLASAERSKGAVSAGGDLFQNRDFRILTESLVKKEEQIQSMQKELDELEEDMKKVPNWVEEVLNRSAEKTKALAEKYLDDKLFLFLGRGISSATALEGRLKLLEITYVPALAYPAGESKHGPISVVEDDTACIFICPRGETHSLVIGSIMEMKARGASIMSVLEEGDQEIKELSDEFIEMPSGIHPLLSPLAYVVPLQLFAYEMADYLGKDVDQPRNLAKSVTVE